MDKIQSSLLLTNYQQQKKQSSGDNLGKDDFLKILMTQLQNQDPMNPLQDKDFVAQMATFSTLEQITNMGKSMDKFVSMQQQSQLISYNQFVGKNVSWHKVTETADGPKVEQGKGTVASVQFKEDTVQFILGDGTKLEPGNISEVNSAAAGSDSTLMQASELIGKTITWLGNDKQEKTAGVKAVGQKEGKTYLELNDAEASKIDASQIIKISS
ncbi:flagellar hook assembly protein FlgD [Peribacillus sp. SCS-37]|uniref:flagellar hook assembly protein FlgD n=1 Tax=Paraperibacillus esterisolvens TaxID=3115296 RepID=UPI00390595BD